MTSIKRANAEGNRATTFKNRDESRKAMKVINARDDACRMKVNKDYEQCEIDARAGASTLVMSAVTVLAAAYLF